MACLSTCGVIPTMSFLPPFSPVSFEWATLSASLAMTAWETMSASSAFQTLSSPPRRYHLPAAGGAFKIRFVGFVVVQVEAELCRRVFKRGDGA